MCRDIYSHAKSSGSTDNMLIPQLICSETTAKLRNKMTSERRKLNPQEYHQIVCRGVLNLQEDEAQTTLIRIYSKENIFNQKFIYLFD